MEQPQGINDPVMEMDSQLESQQRQIDELRDTVQRLKTDAIHDPETALFSNAYFHARLQEEIIRSERYRHFLSLVLIHVKISNPQSVVMMNNELRRLGLELMAGLTRRTDIVAHYRKRQIAIMLPETDPRGTEQLITRFKLMFPENGRRLTYQMITYPQDASNIELVMNRLQDMSEDLFRLDTSPDLPSEY